MEDVGIILKTRHKGLLSLCSGAGDRQPNPFPPDRNLENYAVKENFKQNHYNVTDKRTYCILKQD